MSNNKNSASFSPVLFKDLSYISCKIEKDYNKSYTLENSALIKTMMHCQQERNTCSKHENVTMVGLL